MNEKCNEISELLSRYIDGELSSEEETVLHEHLAVCEDCRNHLELMNKIHQISPDLSETAPPNLVPNVMQAVRVHKKSNRRFSLSNFRFTAIAAVIVVLVLAVGKLPVFETATETNGASFSQETATDTAVSEDAASPVPSSISPASDNGELKQNVKNRSISTYSSEHSRKETAEATDDSEIPYSRDFSFYILIASDSVPMSLQKYPQEIHNGNIFIILPASDREDILNKLAEENTVCRIVEGESSQDSALVMISPEK